MLFLLNKDIAAMFIPKTILRELNYIFMQIVDFGLVLRQKTNDLKIQNSLLYSLCFQNSILLYYLCF